VALEHHAALQAGAAYLAVFHKDVARRGAVQPGQHIEDGGLAAARVADDADELALADGEGHVGKHRPRGQGGAEVFAEPFDLEESLHGVFFL
jgi:hypothetical protein